MSQSSSALLPMWVAEGPTSCVWLNSSLPVMVSKMWAVMCALPGCAGLEPVARNMVLGFRYFSFRLLSPSTCASKPSYAMPLPALSYSTETCSAHTHTADAKQQHLACL